MPRHGTHILSVEPRALNLNDFPKSPLSLNAAAVAEEEEMVACQAAVTVVCAPKSTITSAPGRQFLDQHLRLVAT